MMSSADVLEERKQPGLATCRATVMQKPCSMHPYLNIRNSENDLVGVKTGLNGAGDAGKVSLSAQAGRTVQRYLEAK